MKRQSAETISVLSILVVVITTVMTINVVSGSSGYSFAGIPKTEADQDGHHRLVWADKGNQVKLEYDVEPHPDLVNLDSEQGLEGVDCHTGDGTIVLSYSLEDYAQATHEKLNQDTRIIAGPHWNCRIEQETSLSRLHDKSIRIGNKIKLSTKRAELNHLFKNAKVKFSTSLFPKDREHNDIKQQQHKQHSKRGFFSDVISKAWSDVTSYQERILKVIEYVNKVDKFFDTGDFEENATEPITGFNYNYNNWNESAKDGNIVFSDSVTCTNCYMFWNVTLVVDIIIVNYNLQYLYTAVTGEIGAVVEGLLSIQGDLEYSDKFTLTTLNLTGLYFWLGPLLVNVDIYIPVEAGYDFLAQAQGSMQASISLKGFITQGVLYTDGQWTPVNNYTWTHGGKLGKLSESSDIQFTMYILPTPIVYVDYIGGLYFGVKPFIEAVVTYDSESNNCNPKYNLNMGLTALLGINGSIRINGQDIYTPKFLEKGPWTFYSAKKPILSGCINFEYDNVTVTPGNATLFASVWSGKYHDCNRQATGDIQMQIVDVNSDNHFDLIGSYNLISPDAGSCTTQSVFRGREDYGFCGEIGGFYFSPVETFNSNPIFFQQCTNGNGNSTVVSPFCAWWEGDDLSSMGIAYLQNCHLTFKLHN